MASANGLMTMQNISIAHTDVLITFLGTVLGLNLSRKILTEIVNPLWSLLR